MGSISRELPQPVTVDARSAGLVNPVPPRLSRPVPENTRVDTGPSRPSTRPWWLWPHLLSLDAPLVALAWQEWWGRTGGVPLRVSQRLVLGLGVWMIYLADRLADTARGLPGDTATARHAFAGDHRGPLLVLTGGIGVVLVVLAPCALPPGQFGGGLVLLAVAGAYFWQIHRQGSQRWTARVPKEAAVGGMFALGTSFFAFWQPLLLPERWMAAVASFGTLCFLNCALITSWERNLRDQRDPFSFLNAFPRWTAGGLRSVCWLLASGAGMAGILWRTTFFLPVALGALALGMLDCGRRRIAPDALRTLADAVLLTPWLCQGMAALLR